MKIIDAHLHIFGDRPWAERMAQQVGHRNSAQHLVQYYAQHGFAHGIVMANAPLTEHTCRELPPQFSYCIGLDSGVMQNLPPNAPEIVEAHLQKSTCVGIKLYPGYNHSYIYDEIYEPYYELAAKYHKPVAVHTGATNGSRAKLRYAHPLTLDDAAADHPDVQFVMCHFGNPFLAEAAAVLEKNPNVSADLSGLLGGAFETGTLNRAQAGYMEILKAWLRYVGDWNKFMFGTDWPLVNLAEYAKWVQTLVPESEWEKVFFDNANRIYQLGL